MTEPEILPPVGRAQKANAPVDSHDVLMSITPEEIADGNAMGEAIDIDDDYDNGWSW